MSKPEEEAQRDFEEEESDAKRETASYLEHDWYWIGPNNMKCDNCGIIKDVLFSNPVYRTRTSVKINYEPKCYFRKVKKEGPWSLK